MLFNKISLLYCVWFIAFISHINIADCNLETYAITAPKTIRPGDAYRVIVSLHNVTIPTEVVCTLEQYEQNNTSKINEIKQIGTFNNTDSTIFFELIFDNSWNDGIYKLNVNGKGGLNFNEVIDIKFIYDQLVIMVQTDKAVYKPGETVKFRVILLDKNLKPVDISKIGDIKIYIIDPLDNKLREFFLKNGVLSFDPTIYESDKFNYSKGVTNDINFSLQNEAMLGKWQIQAVIRRQIGKYYFLVEEYQLKLAYVTITLPQYVKYNNTNLEFMVDCFYTFGKPVIGSVKVLISKTSECGKIVENSPVFFQDILIDGQISSKIDLKSTLLLNPKCFEMRLNVTAIVKDSITESIYTNFEVFDFYQKDIGAQLLSKQKKFEPGKIIRQHAKIVSAPGVKISEDILNQIKCEAEMKTAFGDEWGNITHFDVKRDGTNIICDIKTEIIVTEIQSRIVYKENILLESSYGSFTGCSNSFVQVMFENPLERLIVGETVDLMIYVNEPVEKLIYYIVVHGSIVNSSSIALNKSNKPGKEVSILITSEMIPEAIFVVYYISPNSGVVVSDGLKLKISGLIHDEVTFDVRTPSVNTSQKAVMYIEAEPNSELFILGVDEDALDLEQNNDIVEKRVFEELQYYLDGPDSLSGPLLSRMEFKSNTKLECTSHDEIEGFDHNGNNVIKRKDEISSYGKHFRDTWIWYRYSVPHDKSRIGFSFKVPNSINSWKVTAFSIHEKKGLGFTRVPGHVTVSRPFYIKLRLPYSIKREENFEIRVSAFNYLKEISNVNIQLMVSDENVKHFTFFGCSFKLLMKPNEIKALTCQITAHKAGTFRFFAIASAHSGSLIVPDEISQPLLVLYEGVVQHMTKSILFDLTNNNVDDIIERTKIEYPVEAINGSQTIYASVTSELIAIPWKKELENMVTKRPFLESFSSDLLYPGASCQQKTVFTFPKVFWLNFLKKSKKLTKDLTESSAEIIKKTIGLLCFQDPYDGSFMTWDSGNKSSVWQTAYTYKLMNHAKNYVFINSEIIEKTRNWLKHQQVVSGEFLETDTEHKIVSTTNFNTYLTSYVYIALNSNEIQEHNHDAETYLSKVFGSLTHPLDIVITCYALHIANHTSREICYTKVLKMSEIENGIRYWKGTDNKPNLQITAYALMILNNRYSIDIEKSLTTALTIFKYLLSKQHPNGWFAEGFSVNGNSLTTVICIEAMSQFTTLWSSYEPKDENLLINFEIGDEKQSFRITPNDEIIQSLELSAETKEVKLTASGTGRAVARIYWQFNSIVPIGNAFNISAKRVFERGAAYITLNLCTKYNLKDNVKNVILEIDLPSGYTYDRKQMKKIPELVDHIESTHSDTHLNVYLREVTKTEICVIIPSFQSFEVTNMKPVWIRIYPYYDWSQLTTRSWNISNVL